MFKKADNKVLFPQPPTEVEISRLDASLALPLDYQLAALALGEDFVDRIIERVDRERNESPPAQGRRRKARR